MGRLSNKVVLITGGAGGIGADTAELFVKEGAKVFLVDLDEKALSDVANKLPKDSVGYQAADVSKAADTKSFVKATVDKFGKIDAFFINAGIEGVVKPLTEYPEDMFDKVMAVNVKSVWLGMREVFPYMQENGGGSIMITSSVAGLQGTPNVIAYVTSKHATVGAMKVGALEGAPHQIRVNTIHPSPVDNRMMRSLEEGFAPGAAEAAKKNFEEMIPLKRYAENRDISNLALFLASDESKFITGAQYVIDGGITT
ncbi:MAG: glucose 1-dehydrogenase [Bernardetiaceae bacterium]|nr:glucose 1-dehydrogenase [Bernardetiaceae bacterium]